MTTFHTNAGGWEPIAVKISNSTVTDIVDGTAEAWQISWLSVGENNNSTPNVTVELYDGTTSIYLVADGYCWNAQAMTGRMGISFDDIVVPIGSKLRVKSSDASGRLDVTGIKTRVGAPA